MTEQEERAYINGRRAVLVEQIQSALRELGYGVELTQAARLLVEREQAIAALRRVCNEHGDNDWADNLNLADIIEKHLEKHLA